MSASTERAAEDLLNSIFTVATVLLRGERASLLLREQGDDDHFVIVLARGIAEEVGQRVRVREGEGVAGKVAATKLPLLVRDGEARGVGTYRSTSYMSVPILVADRAQGILNVTDRADGLPFEQDDLDTLQVLADHIAACLVQRSLDAELRQLADTDPVTRLFNRRHFDRRLDAEQARARRVGEPLALLRIGVNDFSRVSERLGASAGNDVLRGVAEAIRRAVRPYDLPVRYAEDEFAVILPNVDSSPAVRVGERIQSALASTLPAEIVASVPGVGLSIGVAVLPGADDAATLTEQATSAMRDARERGGGVVSWVSTARVAAPARRAIHHAPYLAEPGRLANAELQALVPQALAEEWNALAIGREGVVLTVAMPEPANAAVDALSQATGLAIYPVYGPAEQLEEARRSLPR